MEYKKESLRAIALIKPYLEGVFEKNPLPVRVSINTKDLIFNFPHAYTDPAMTIRGKKVAEAKIPNVIKMFKINARYTEPESYISVQPCHYATSVSQREGLASLLFKVHTPLSACVVDGMFYFLPPLEKLKEEIRRNVIRAITDYSRLSVQCVSYMSVGGSYNTTRKRSSREIKTHLNDIQLLAALEKDLAPRIELHIEDNKTSYRFRGIEIDPNIGIVSIRHGTELTRLSLVHDFKEIVELIKQGDPELVKGVKYNILPGIVTIA